MVLYGLLLVSVLIQLQPHQMVLIGQGLEQVYFHHKDWGLHGMVLYGLQLVQERIQLRHLLTLLIGQGMVQVYFH
jgi:hypothetical protein